MEVSVRKGETPAEILSVTNREGFVRSLDVFDKQVFSQDASNYKLVRLNDLAYNPSRINVGSIALCEFPDGGAVSPMYVVVRCRDTLLPKFLLYFLKSDVGKQHIVHRSIGAVRFMLRFGDLEQVELPIPPVREQRRIVRILDEVSSLAQLRREADERTGATAASLFSHMFGDPASDAKNWGAVTLGDLGTIVTGNTPPRSDPSFYGDFIEWVKTDNIDATRNSVGVSAERLSKTGAMRGRVVPEGAVLVTCIAGSVDRIGDAAITNRKVAINQQINAVLPLKKVEGAFLGELVRTLKPLIQARATGVMTRIINKSELERIPAIAPPFALQQKFANRVAAIRELETTQIASGKRLNDLSQAIVYYAFQGQL